jgi:glucokinase
MSYTDIRLQQFASNVVRPGVVVVIISSSGRLAELIDVADKARARGAKVVAITASLSPLARKADVALIVDHAEDVVTQLPMIGRILHLLMVDILAVGVAMRRGVQAAAPLGADDTAAPDEAQTGAAGSALAQSGTPGVHTAAQFAHLTTHSRIGSA